MDANAQKFNERIAEQAEDILKDFRKKCEEYIKKITVIIITLPNEPEYAELRQNLNNIINRLQNAMNISVQNITSKEANKDYIKYILPKDSKTSAKIDRRIYKKIDKNDKKIGEIINKNNLANQSVDELLNNKKYKDLLRIKNKKAKLYTKQLKIMDKGLIEALNNYMNKVGINFKVYDSIIVENRDRAKDRNEIKEFEKKYGAGLTNDQMLNEYSSISQAKQANNEFSRLDKLRKSVKKSYMEINEAIIKNVSIESLRKMKEKAQNLSQSNTNQNQVNNTQGSGVTR